MTPQEHKPNNRWRVAGVIAAVAATTAVGGIAYATDLPSALSGNGSVNAADPTPSPSSSPPNAPSNAPDKPGRMGPHGGMFGFGGALHGEYVVSKEGGGYQTVASQRGEVTAVSKDSLTVKSEDGYSRTYKLTEDTLVNAARDGIDDVKNGNTVNVSATVEGGNATAVSVDDGTVRDAARDRWGFKRGPR